MPAVSKPSMNGHPRLAQCPRLREAWERFRKGTDEILIGSAESITSSDESDAKAGSMADVMKRVEGVRYLVKGWIPFAMVTMLLAPPGVGKSAFALFALVRVLVVGGLEWFNGTRGPEKPRFVLVCDTEGAGAISVQRINDWGLPPERILVPFEDDPLLPINLANDEHLRQIEAIIIKYAIWLVVIDSLRGAHDGDENSSRVAQVLQKLAAIAERTKAAIVVIHHSRKLGEDEELSADSSRGSNAIYAMVRSQLGIDQPNKNSEWRRLRMLKENLGLKPPAVGFRITSSGLEFGPAPDKPRQQTEKSRAEDWLKANMQPGKWYKAGELEDEARQDGFSETALRRARNDLGITKTAKCLRKTKEGWEWMLPPAQGKTAGKTPGKNATS